MKISDGDINYKFEILGTQATSISFIYQSFRVFETLNKRSRMLLPCQLTGRWTGKKTRQTIIQRRIYTYVQREIIFWKESDTRGSFFIQPRTKILSYTLTIYLEIIALDSSLDKYIIQAYEKIEQNNIYIYIQQLWGVNCGVINYSFINKKKKKILQSWKIQANLLANA